MSMVDDERKAEKLMKRKSLHQLVPQTLKMRYHFLSLLDECLLRCNAYMVHSLSFSVGLVDSSSAPLRLPRC